MKQKWFIIIACLFSFTSSTLAALEKCAYCHVSTHSTERCPRVHSKDRSNKGYITQNGRNFGEDNVRSDENSELSTRSRVYVIETSPPVEGTHNVAGEGNYAKELAAYREKQAEQSRLKAQAGTEKAYNQKVDKLNQKADKLTEEKSALEAKLVDAVMQNQKLQKQAEYYEKYARSLHKQLINNPELFKKFTGE